MRKADKQQPITMGKVVKILKPNFDDHVAFPQVQQFGRYEYLWGGEGIPNKNPKSAGIESAIQELKNLFCNNFKIK